MKLTVSATRVRADLLVLPIHAGPGGALPGPGVAEAGFDGLLPGSALTGAEGEELLAAGQDGTVALLVGLGPLDRVDADTLRRVTSRAVRRAARHGLVVTTLPQVLPSTANAVASGAVASGAVASGAMTSGAAASGAVASGAVASGAVAEGALLGAYAYRDARGPGEVMLLVADEQEVAAARRAVESATIVCSSVNWARDLVNAPAGELTPMALADEARRMGEEAGLQVTVLDAEALRTGGYGGILAVGGGSANPPCLIEVVHPGDGRRTVGLAGKGITFDSGGLRLKTKAAMSDMKTDMAGGAAMLATVRAAAALGCPVGVRAVVPAAENMPGGNAYRPGDVVRHRNGKTTEVIDTDAEGRVVLADALSHLAESRPDVIVDAATLTYSVVAALGDEIGGVLGTDRALVGGLLDAADAVAEPLWELPLWEGYRRNVASPVADLRNDGGPNADVIHAALYLREFTAGLPWAHLDIAGTAYVEEPDARPDRPAGATGTGVRTLVHWLQGDSAWPGTGSR